MNSDEFGMRRSRRLVVEKKYLPGSTWTSSAAAELVQVAVIASLANT